MKKTKPAGTGLVGAARKNAADSYIVYCHDLNSCSADSASFFSTKYQP